MVCIQGVLCLALAFVPAMMITQTALLVLGVVALVKIRRSHGTLAGGWMTVTGLIVSALLWGLILTVVVMMARGGGFR